MKKIISILIFGFLAFGALAQNNKAIAVTTTAYGNALDTVDNAESHYTNTSTVPDWNGSKTVQAQVIVKKISGTVGGTLGLYGSMDGIEWTICETATTPSDGSANYYISTSKRFAKYRIGWTGTGTMSASFRTYFLY